MKATFLTTEQARRQARYIQVPLALLDSPAYAGVSSDAKLLYARMHNRTLLSAQNPGKFTDGEGRLFIYYSQQEVMEKFRVSKNTAGKMVKQLEDAGLIRRKKTAGRNTLIYVMEVPCDGEAPAPRPCAGNREGASPVEKEAALPNSGSGAERPPEGFAGAFSTEFSTGYQTDAFRKVITPKNRESGIANPGNRRSQNLTPSYIYEREKYREEPILPSQPSGTGRRGDSLLKLEKKIREQIDEDWLLATGYSREQVREVERLIRDAMCRTGPLAMDGGLLPEAAVRKRMMELEPEHVAYALDAVNTARGVKNPRKYLLVALYNAPAGMETAVNQQVFTDLDYGGRHVGM